MPPQDPSSLSSSESTVADDPSAPSADAASFSPIVVLGGGEAGTAVLEALSDAGLAADSALIEPSPYHYEQPEWMRVGTEGMEKEQTRSPTQAEVPAPVTWVQERVTEIDPDAQLVRTREGSAIRYDYLVVALGTTPHWDRIRGLASSLGSHGICSVYGYEQAEHAWDMIRAFEGGRAIFTAPSTPHKGGRAPLRILRRAASLWRETGVRARTDLYFATATSTSVEEEESGDDDIHVYTGYDLIEVRHSAQEAVFRVTKGLSQSQNVLPYDLLHVVPPMRPPGLLEQSGLAYQDGTMKGYMEVHPDSFRHKRFGSVFGVGDAIGVEGAKTGERAREQAVAVARVLERIVAQDE